MFKQPRYNLLLAPSLGQHLVKFSSGSGSLVPSTSICGGLSLSLLYQHPSPGLLSMHQPPILLPRSIKPFCTTFPTSPYPTKQQQHHHHSPHHPQILDLNLPVLNPNSDSQHITSHPYHLHQPSTLMRTYACSITHLARIPATSQGCAGSQGCMCVCVCVCVRV